MKYAPDAKRNSRDIEAISSYITESMKAGYSRDRITMNLRTAGWSEDEIKSAYEHENVPTSEK
ncbi:MAG: hypothetical protein HQM09_06570 [Candidatus Riflebacteria bacterium]|nr:hypothetical protein [Candidatus Riflebacteria bacterium]